MCFLGRAGLGPATGGITFERSGHIVARGSNEAGGCDPGRTCRLLVPDVCLPFGSEAFVAELWQTALLLLTDHVDGPFVWHCYLRTARRQYSCGETQEDERGEG